MFRLSRNALILAAILAIVDSAYLGARPSSSLAAIHRASAISVRCAAMGESVVGSSKMTHARWVIAHLFVQAHYVPTLRGKIWQKLASHPAQAHRLVVNTCRPTIVARAAALKAAAAKAAVVRTAAVHTRSSSSISLGAAMEGAPFNMQPLNAYSQLVGRAPSILMWYRQWNEPLISGTEVSDVIARGMTPIITWEPWDPSAANASDNPAYSFSAILSGAFDTYIEASAREAAAVGRPFLINFAPEMNGAWEPWGPGVNGNTASQYVAVYRKVVDMFRAAGATNVGWIWDPNTAWNSSTTYKQYYPGDGWVDWVGMDGYNFGTTTSDGWLTPQQIFSGSYASLRALTSKPVIIEETGCAEQGGNKSAWITRLATYVPQYMPAVRALVWFNVDKEADWRVNSSPAALQSFQQLAASPGWGGGPLGVRPGG